MGIRLIGEMGDMQTKYWVGILALMFVAGMAVLFVP